MVPFSPCFLSCLPYSASHLVIVLGKEIGGGDEIWESDMEIALYSRTLGRILERNL